MYIKISKNWYFGNKGTTNWVQTRHSSVDGERGIEPIAPDRQNNLIDI